MARRKRAARGPRVPRDSAANIYRTCKQAGTCPPDVINKVEHTTVADKILQYGSAGVFLGGLGIGTGRGTGGPGGYVPVGETPGVSVGTRPIPRPSIPVDTIGPSDLVPIDAIRPTDPSIIDLSSAPTPSDPMVAPDIEVIAEIHPVPPEGPINTPTTTIETSGSGDVAVLEVAPEPSPPKRARLRATKTTHHNPAFHSFSTTSSTIGESSGMESIRVLSGSGGRTIGGEHIELRSFPSSVDRFNTEIVEETEFGLRTSTPTGSRRYAPPPSRRYYQYTETPLRDLWSPRTAVGAEYINPAYEGDVSLEFPESASVAPNRDFTGVTRLGRLFAREHEGAIRVGRLGQKASLRTRSGLTVGPRDYFYNDLSSIHGVPTPDTIELSTLSAGSDRPLILGEDSGQVVDTVVDDTSSFEMVSLSSWAEHTDASLLEEDIYEFSGHLVFGSGGRGPSQITLKLHGRQFPGSGVHVDYGGVSPDDLASGHDTPRPSPITPTYTGPSTGAGYYLHPSLHRRRRKRRHSHI